MIFRDERPDEAAILADLITRAFRTAPHACGREAAVVEALRRRGELALSLVAAGPDGPLGHLAASPARLAGRAGWAGLGPLAVDPAHQRQGIGRRLMQQGLARLQQAGFAGAILVGDPGYYHRFGLTAGGVTLAGVPGEFVLARAFAGPPPRGEAMFSPAFAP